MGGAMRRLPLGAALLLVLVLVVAARRVPAAEWTPQAWVDEGTLEVRTIGPDEGEHWFPVWLVVLDGELYVRLGSRAVGRIEKNTAAPYVGVRVAGQQFDRVRADPAPDKVAPVAQAMGEKYWSDLLIRYFPHPMTLRLVAEPDAGR
jgi:hypothetical protein